MVVVTKGATVMPDRISAAVRRIVQARTLPGLLLFNVRGQLLCTNPAADLILPDPHQRSIIQSIRGLLAKTQAATVWPRQITDSPAGPFFQSVLRSGIRSYGLQAFWLNHQPKGRPPLVAILVERVSPARAGRAGFEKAQRRFHLSPRELDVIQALRTGMSDKEIAAALGIGFETVRDYLKTIRRKLSVSTRTAIVNAVLSN
jgi:DNA-binding CsgD family transcriptional regulator